MAPIFTGLRTKFWGFIPMKLQQRVGYGVQGGTDFGNAGVDEQQHRSDKRR